MKRATPASGPVTSLQKQAPAATPSSPVRSSPYSAQDLPIAKRQKVEASASVTPSTSNPGTPVDSLLIPLSKQAARLRAQYLRDCGETEWVLSTPYTRLPEPSITSSEATPNGQDEDIWTGSTSGRQTFGSFRRKNKTVPGENSVTWTSKDASADDNETDYSPESDLEHSLSTPLHDLSSSTKTKRKSSDMRTPSKTFNSDKVDLSKLYSLSGGGANKPSSNAKRYKEIDSNRHQYGRSFAQDGHRKTLHKTKS